MSMKQEVRQNTWKATWLAVVATLLAVAAHPLEAGIFECPDGHWKCASGNSISFGRCYHIGSGCTICSDDWQDGCRRQDNICDEGKTTSSRRDGCSGGPKDTIFEPACNEHDVCYTTPGRSKSDCDNEFLRNMEEMCRLTFSGEELPNCSRTAQTYYIFVQTDPAWQGYRDDQAWAKRLHCGNPQPSKIVFSRHGGGSGQVVSYWAGSALPDGSGGPVPSFTNPPQDAWIDLKPGENHTIQYAGSQPTALQEVFFSIIKDNDGDHAVCVISANLQGDGTLVRATSNCPSSVRVSTNHNEVAVSLPLHF